MNTQYVCSHQEYLRVNERICEIEGLPVVKDEDYLELKALRKKVLFYRTYLGDGERAPSFSAYLVYLANYVKPAPSSIPDLNGLFFGLREPTKQELEVLSDYYGIPLSEFARN